MGLLLMNQKKVPEIPLKNDDANVALADQDAETDSVDSDQESNPDANAQTGDESNEVEGGRRARDRRTGAGAI